MPLTKAKGNMYSWCSHTHSHLAGECPHRCSYCYVQAMARRFKAERWTGPLRLVEEEFNMRYGSGKTIFIEHMNDLFAEAVPAKWIERILKHCQQWPDNTYVFQTKNPKRMARLISQIPSWSLVGTTIESNRQYENMGNAPHVANRHIGMVALRIYRPIIHRFVTIEPVMDFDLGVMLGWIGRIRPQFVNIGADSKGGNLPEPSADKILALIDGLKNLGIEIRQKTNLERLLNA